MEPQELDEFLLWKPDYPEAVIGNGVLYAQSKMIVYGRYKSFKSMLALYTAKAIAYGRDWFDIPTSDSGVGVLYLQSEIPHPLLRKRVEKMRRYWPDPDGQRQPIYYWTEPYLKLDRSEGLALVTRRIKEINPAVVIIDPVYKLMSGNILDPNSVRGLLDTIDGLIGNHSISIILIHHPRKSGLEEDMEWGTDDMLGSVLFSAWADTIVKITRKGGKEHRDSLQLNFDIVRHAEDFIEPKEVMFNRDTLEFTTGQAILV